MPSKSEKQAKLMRAVKHNPKFAKKVGIPQSVGRDFVAADKRIGRYAAGGGVLGTLGRAAGQRMRPIPDARVPPMPAMIGADRVSRNAGDRLRILRARGGKA